MPSRVEIRDLLESMGVEFDRSLRKKELQAILDRVVEERGSPAPRASRARTRAEAIKEAEEQTAEIFEEIADLPESVRASVEKVALNLSATLTSALQDGTDTEALEDAQDSFQDAISLATILPEGGDVDEEAVDTAVSELDESISAFDQTFATAPDSLREPEKGAFVELLESPNRLPPAADTDSGSESDEGSDGSELTEDTDAEIDDILENIGASLYAGEQLEQIDRADKRKFAAGIVDDVLDRADRQVQARSTDPEDLFSSSASPIRSGDNPDDAGIDALDRVSTTIDAMKTRVSTVTDEGARYSLVQGINSLTEMIEEAIEGNVEPQVLAELVAEELPLLDSAIDAEKFEDAIEGLRSVSNAADQLYLERQPDTSASESSLFPETPRDSAQSRRAPSSVAQRMVQRLAEVGERVRQEFADSSGRRGSASSALEPSLTAPSISSVVGAAAEGNAQAEEDALNASIRSVTEELLADPASQEQSVDELLNKMRAGLTQKRAFEADMAAIKDKITSPAQATAFANATRQTPRLLKLIAQGVYAPTAFTGTAGKQAAAKIEQQLAYSEAASKRTGTRLAANPIVARERPVHGNPNIKRWRRPRFTTSTIG
jgi:hypothetical protein